MLDVIGRAHNLHLPIERVVHFDIDDPADCLAKFHSNEWLGAVVLAAIVAGGLAG